MSRLQLQLVLFGLILIVLFREGIPSAAIDITGEILGSLWRRLNQAFKRGAEDWENLGDD